MMAQEDDSEIAKASCATARRPFHTGRSPFTVTRVPARVCGQ